MIKLLKNKSLIFLLLCIFALVGCGKNQDKMDKTTEAKETTEDIIDDTTTESAKDDVTEADYNWFYETYGVEYGINNIDELSRDYSVENAIEDGCFVIGAMVHNDYLYDEFMKQYENEEIAYIRVVQSTTEGDAIIYDIFYRPESKEWMDAAYPERLFVVVDSTRDKFAAEDDRTITMGIFDGVAEYEGDTGLYWVAYRGNVDDIDLDSDDTFVIAHIN